LTSRGPWRSGRVRSSPPRAADPFPDDIRPEYILPEDDDIAHPVPCLAVLAYTGIIEHVRNIDRIRAVVLITLAVTAVYTLDDVDAAFVYREVIERPGSPRFPYPGRR